MRILLLCSAGMSTSLVVARMKEAAEAQGKEGYEIWASDVQSLEKEMGHFDVCLLGPQIVYMKRRVARTVGDKAPVDVIAAQAYGLCDGKAVLKHAERLYDEWKKENGKG